MTIDPLQVAREFISQMDMGDFDGSFSTEVSKLSYEALAAVASLLELRLKKA
jgi:hypothetical protein